MRDKAKFTMTTKARIYEYAAHKDPKVDAPDKVVEGCEHQYVYDKAAKQWQEKLEADSPY